MIYVIRHGEPTMRGVFLGTTDPGLSEQGREQASGLSVVEAAVVYASPRLRARETAAWVRGPEAEILEGLGEIDFGEWEGMTWGEIEVAWPEESRKKQNHWLSVTPPGGERFEDFRVRVAQAWGRVLAGKRPAAVVAHLVVNAVIAELVTGQDPLTYMQGYAEVRRYEI
jgi:broad specificity phosphatase PhoE